MAGVLTDIHDALVSQSLEGLSDKDVISIYNTGDTKSLDAGQFLFKEGDRDQKVFLVLKGSFRLVKKLGEETRQVGIVDRGDWITASFSGQGRQRDVSAVCSEPANVLILSEAALDALAPNLGVAVYRSLQKATALEEARSLEREKESFRQARHLSRYVRDLVETRNAGYNRSEMIQTIVKSVPRLPRYATDLASRFLNEAMSAQEVIDLAKADPSLAGVILKTVNSGYYNFTKKISDIHHAVMLLGFHQVYQLVVADGVRKTMPDNPEFHELHVHSLLISLIAFELSVLLAMEKASTLSTVGLVHDVGKSVILLLKRKYPKLDMLVDTLDHAKVGSLLLKEWSIPDALYRTVEYQAYPEFCPPGDIPQECRKDVAILYLSHCCYEYLRAKKGEEVPGAFLEEYLRFLSSSRMSLSNLVRSHLLPSLRKKKDSLPQLARQLLEEGQQHSESVHGTRGGD